MNPQNLNTDQKRARPQASSSICARFKKDADVLKHVVTADETVKISIQFKLHGHRLFTFWTASFADLFLGGKTRKQRR